MSAPTTTFEATPGPLAAQHELIGEALARLSRLRALKLADIEARRLEGEAAAARRAVTRLAAELLHYDTAGCEA